MPIQWLRTLTEKVLQRRTQVPLLPNFRQKARQDSCDICLGIGLGTK
jgi:hypothetical protein